MSPHHPVAIVAGVLGTLGVCACNTVSSGSKPTPAVGISTAKRTASFVPPPVPSAQPVVDPGEPCGGLECRAFNTAAAAFEVVLAEEPRVLALGEAHTPKDEEQIPSSTKRFTEQLLPLLKGRAQSLIVELWLGRGDCGDTRVERVEKAQRPVIQTQSSNNQDEYVALGTAAKKLGIFPHALTPSCDDYQHILQAGAGDIETMLTLIAERTAELTEQLLTKEAAPHGMVLLYGGAMHNDIRPKPGRETMSFGPRLQQLLGSHYVELDLFVREFIRDDDAWKKLPFYPYYQADLAPTKTLLYRPAPGSFTLIFPSYSNTKEKLQ